MVSPRPQLRPSARERWNVSVVMLAPKAISVGRAPNRSASARREDAMSASVSAVVGRGLVRMSIAGPVKGLPNGLYHEGSGCGSASGEPPAPGTKLRDKWLWEMLLRGAGRGKLLPKTRGFRYDSAPGGDWLRRV